MIKEVKSTWSHCELDYVKEFIIHNEKEVAKLPKCCIGSTAFVCETGESFVCCKDGSWKPKKEAMAEGGGSGGGASSWNDLTDKPFYEEGGMVEVLAETTLTVEGGENGVIIPDVLDVSIGDKCVVTYNGIEYECEAQSFEAEGFVIITLGDVGAATGGEMSGEYPFAIMAYPADIAPMVGGGATVITLDDSVSMTVSIKKDNTVIHPIEQRFIVLTSPNGTKYNLSVSDDGALTATAI